MNSRTPDAPPPIKALPSDSLRPLWSVMIPTYNCIEYVKEAIESVLVQDPGSEIMQIEVVDDFSTDGDIEALVKTVGKGRVQFFRQDYNRGSLRNFETCINRANGQYIHLLHGDDRIEPGYYGEITELFSKHREAGAAFTNFFYIDHTGSKLAIKNNSILSKPGVIKDFLFQIAQRQLIQPPAITVKRTVYESLGSFYAVHFGEDWEMWARIALNYEIAYSPKYLASYRVAHGIGISHSYFLTGQNTTDIKKVIDIIQNYLPTEKRVKYKRIALEYYAIYCIKIANGLLLDNRSAALEQTRQAWGMSKNLSTLFWVIRFYLMHLLRYKQIEKWSQSR